MDQKLRHQEGDDGMKKKTKAWLITATTLVLIGCMLFGGVMTMLKWDFTKLSTETYKTNSHEIHEAYQNISITTDTADVVIVPSKTQATSVTCYETETMQHSVSVKENTLVIELLDTRKWYEYISINFATPKITVSIPQGEYGSLVLKATTGDVEITKHFAFKSIDLTGSTGHVTNCASAAGTIRITRSTGNINLENISAGALDLSVSTSRITGSNLICKGDAKINVSTGKTILSNLECKNLISTGSTGSVSLTDVIATETFSIKRSTGDVTFDNSDAAEISVETGTGSVTGTLRSEKVFILETDTGKINVPKTTSGGVCKISTNTGDIELEVK